MALPKKVKVGGSFYKGYKLVVSATPGDYVLDMTHTDACAINGITITPDAYGAGDYFKLQHLGSDSVEKRVIAETIFNVGANSSWLLDLAAMEMMSPGDKFRLTYTNVAGTAINVYTNVERIR